MNFRESGSPVTQSEIEEVQKELGFVFPLVS